MTRTVDIIRPNASLADLVSLVQQGTEVVLADGNVPVARLVPIPGSGGTRVAGLNPGAMSASEDFDAPLPDSFWTGSE
ncbi:MAG TPA: hypothetical protein VGS41_09495 [Chthonomonadales bacterium]|nr:hypothetical protein [Chthonomonadales bacterium]